MSAFETLLQEHLGPLQRYIRFRVSTADAEDILQETLLSAYRAFGSLNRPESFKPWILQIARRKIADHYRTAEQPHIPLEELSEAELSDSRWGPTLPNAVLDTLDLLPQNERQILELYYLQDKPQAEIAEYLGIPAGTVKSRLYTAREHFKKCYPYQTKGENHMKQLPNTMPAYTITPSDKAPFPVVWEELMGWFLVPRDGEKLLWKMYDQPSGKCTQSFELKVTGKAEVHGVEGVSITSVETEPDSPNKTMERQFIAQLTDTHCRYLATSFMENGVHKYYTFLDGDSFLHNWGFGEDNCGNETHISPKGTIRRDGDNVTTDKSDFLLDVVGRYTVTIGGKSYDTICVMDVENYAYDGTASEQFLDQNGRTILWRRFNCNNWRYDRQQKLWTELLPGAEKLIIDGEIYVHWYDCITDYICEKETAE